MSGNTYRRRVAMLAAQYGYSYAIGGKHVSLTAPDKPRIIASITPRDEDTALVNIEKDLKKGKPTWK